MIMVGARGHDIGTLPAPELAARMKSCGADAVQMVAYKAISGVSDKPGHMDAAAASAIGQAFKENGVRISMLGSYFNLLEDPEALAADMERFKEYLAFAKDFGCGLVGTETGSYDAQWRYHPENHTDASFEKVVEIIKSLAVTGEACGVSVGIEGAYSHVIYSPARMAELLERVESSSLRVILDPVNYLHIGNYREADRIIDDAIRLFGERIELIHAKDFLIEEGRIKQVAIGQGMMDYQRLKRKIDTLERDIDIIVEELEGDDLIESIDYLKEIGF